MEEISLRDIIEIILKGKWLITVIVIICMIAGFIGPILLNPYISTAKTVMEINYEGIGKGLNPDGSEFDSSSIKAPVIIDRALKSLKLSNISVDAVRRDVDIRPVIPTDIATKIAAMAKDGKDFTYYPNQFVITFSIRRSLGISKSVGTQIVDTIIKEYSKYCFDRYSGKDTVANAIGTLNYDEYDYPEVSTVIRNQIGTMSGFLDSKIKDDGGFRSKNTSMTFGDISTALNTLDKIEVSNLDSIIKAFNLTRDKEKLITKYEYTIKNDELQKSKKESEAKVAKDMMDSFKQENKMVLLPGLMPTTTNGTENNNPTTQENNSYYDKLAERSTDAGVEATNTEHDIEYFKTEIEKLKKDDVSIELKQSAQKDVDDLIPRIKSKLQNLIDVTNNTTEEYFNIKYATAVMGLSPAVVYPAVNFKINLAIAFVLGLLLGGFVAFVKEYWRNSRIVVTEKIVNQT